MRMTEQTKVLKDEIRRLERNQARENAISNMEYLKNIVYKVRCTGVCCLVMINAHWSEVSLFSFDPMGGLVSVCLFLKAVTFMKLFK